MNACVFIYKHTCNTHTVYVIETQRLIIESIIHVLTAVKIIFFYINNIMKYIEEQPKTIQLNPVISSQMLSQKGLVSHIEQNV